MGFYKMVGRRFQDEFNQGVQFCYNQEVKKLEGYYLNRQFLECIIWVCVYEEKDVIIIRIRLYV